MTNLLTIPARAATLSRAATLASPARITAEQEKFHQTFKYCGAKHREFRNRCIGMLPRILEERIYEKKGFDSIGEYAGKLAGISRAQIGLTLSLHRKFKDKPALKELLVSGKVGLSKLARVASIATTENQEFLSVQALLLSQKALETLVRDLRAAQQSEKEQSEGNLLAACAPTRNDNSESGRGNLFQNANGLYQPQNAPKVLRAQKIYHLVSEEKEFAKTDEIMQSQSAQPQPQMAAPLKLTQLKLSALNLNKLLGLQEKGIDINQIITEALAAREEEIAREKAKLTNEAHEKALAGINTPSRYIPIKIRRHLKKEHGEKCAKHGCNNAATQT
ncbi:hypothetical protein KJ951_02740, partial [Patescibacteria group bacterium]|nr:hypothetical protein [Patescibacteria group bacterium]